MSRIGKTRIEVPESVTVVREGTSMRITGPKGELGVVVPKNVSVVQEGTTLTIGCKLKDTKNRALHGLIRATITNMLRGVTAGWSKTLELSGVGFRARVENGNLILTVGFSHEVHVNPPKGITFSVNEGKILVSGNDKQVVGQTAANIRNIKKPEPYKGKGIKYQGEHIRKKAGKSAKAIGGAPGAAAGK